MVILEIKTRFLQDLDKGNQQNTYSFSQSPEKLSFLTGRKLLWENIRDNYR